MKTLFRVLVVLAILSLLLIAAAPAQEGATLPEPWATLLFLLLLPLLVQGYKIWRDKAGKAPPDLAVQAVVFVISGLFVYAGGGFAGMKLPIFPAFGGDAIGFVGALIVYAGNVIQVVGLLFGAVTGLYVVVYKAFMEKTLGFAKASTLMELGKA